MLVIVFKCVEGSFDIGYKDMWGMNDMVVPC